MITLLNAWNQFWFQPRSATTLALIRIATGAMLAYMHAVWCLRLEDFMGPEALVDNELIGRLHRDDFAWSYLWSIDSMRFLWVHQGVAILAAICMCAGLLTRLVTPLVWFMTLMVCHRMTGFLFGLDQVVMLLTMYLMVAPAGSVWSVDAWIARIRTPANDANRFGVTTRPLTHDPSLRRRGEGSKRRERLVEQTESRGSEASTGTGQSFSRWLFPSPQPSSMVTVATRLIQIHLCIVYLFGGVAKLRGEMWWDGTAMWFSAVAYEYQSLDLTWLGRYPILCAIVTHITLFWETFYCALVWQRWSRPFILILAIAVHGGIALFLGMITFGLMMMVANLAFVEPAWIERMIERIKKQGDHA